ncbi:hypothetical protein [Corynebacterium aurimucosum]
MSTPTRKEIIDAHNALDRIYQHLLFDKDVNLKALDDAVSAVHRALPPKPLPTMDEVEWDDDVHYLAEAEHTDWGTAIMLRYDMGFDRIQIFRTGAPNKFGFASPDSLTPTGKRYTLTEVQE